MNPMKTTLPITVVAIFLALASPASQSITYDPAGRLIGVDYGTNRTVSLAYDNAGNLLETS